MEIIAGLLAFSVLGNLGLLFLYLKKNKTIITHSIEARELLKDLLSGSALIKIQVVDKESIFLRSPKDL